jgi:ribonuclease HII
MRLKKALCWSLGRAEPHEIDELNILHATMLAMQRAVAGLSIVPEFVLIDGNRCPSLPMPSGGGQRRQPGGRNQRSVYSGKSHS